MARPTKQGIDYFPIDCQFDDKIEMYLIEKGAPGFAVLVALWQMIYSNEGYYILNNKDLHLLIKRKIDVDVNEVNSCINVCLSRNVFNQELHEKHEILTSKAIQKRYFEAAKKKKTVQIISHYIINGIDSFGNWVYVAGNATNVKEDVNVNVNVNVDKDIKKKNPSKPKKFLKPKIVEIQAYCAERKNSVNPIRFFNHYESNGWKVGKNSMKNWKSAIITWENSDFNNSSQNVTQHPAMKELPDVS